jgi:tetratricopeptide (TPR) repeat protein
MSESSSGSAFTYRAFISYSHADKAWADWLHKALETYRVPSRLVGTRTPHGVIPRRLNPVFRDREELASAAELGRKVNAALAQSENLVVLCSPAAATSRWVNEEVLAYKRMGRIERIFCLIVDGEPDATDKPGREAEECFCPALRYPLDEQGQPTRERTEPIAADARPGKDGKQNARLKLIAGMLDVGFDALKQREQQRRVRRMTAITALALVVMAVTSVLAVYALISRHKAVIAQQTAVRRQKQAEGLVGFMLGDLYDKLQQVNRLDIMQAVDDKAMAYFKSLPNTDVNEAALAQRAKTLEKIGGVRLETGDITGALKAYRASAGISSRLAAASPLDVTRQIAYSRTLTFIGMAHWQQGQLAKAEQAFEFARRVLLPFAKRVSRDPALLRQLSYIDDNLGHVLEARGMLDAALDLFRERLNIDNILVAAKSATTADRSDLGAAHNDLGKLALQRGDLAKAIAEYRADDAIETSLSAQNPKDNYQLENTLMTRAILGRTLALAGDSTPAIHDLQQSVDMARKLMQFDPHHADFADELALYSAQLARLQRLNGNLSAAHTLCANATSVLSQLSHKYPDNGYFGSDYAAALTEQAEQSRADGNPDAAREQAQAALQILEPKLARHSGERETLLATMAAKLLLASVSSDPQTTRTLRELASATMQTVKADRGDPRLLALQVDALLALGRNAEAQPLLKQLWSTGYRDRAFVDLLQREHIAYPANPAFKQRIANIMSTNPNGFPHPPAAGRN